MTCGELKRQKFHYTGIKFAFFFVFVFVLLFFASEIRTAIEKSIMLAVTTVIPSLFPFIILSDYLCSVEINSSSKIAKTAEKLFGIPSTAISSVIIGLLCGFPLGVKSACELYERELIDEEELGRLSGCINNPSLGFTVSAVGVGLRGSIKDGLLLFFAITFSSFLLLALTRRKCNKFKNPGIISRQKFKLSSSIKGATSALILISSYIIFFSALIGVIETITKSTLISALTASILEVSSASKIIAGYSGLSYSSSMLFSAFALGFSGFSVHLQSLNYIHSRSAFLRYLLLKLLMGLTSCLVMLCLLIFA